MEQKRGSLENLVNLNKNFWKNKKILITGHTGFKGSWLSLLLISLGSKVYGYSLRPNNDQKLFTLLNLKKKMSLSKYGNIVNYKELENFCKRVNPDIIIHMAAQSLVINAHKNTHGTFKTNILGTINLLDISNKMKNLRIFVNVTTDKVYQVKKNKSSFKETDNLNSNDPYGISKVCSDLITQSNNYFKKNKSIYCVVRSGNVIGGGDFSQNRLVPDIIRSYNSNSTLVIRNSKHIRPWQYVFEPLYGYLRVIEFLYSKRSSQNNYSWNFGPNKSSFISVKKLIKNFHKHKKLKYSISDNNNFKENPYLTLNSTKSKKILRWKTIFSIDKTIKNILEWNDCYIKRNKYEIEKLSIKQIKDYFCI